MVWFYFGSGHGKGVHDGVRTILKQEIQKEQMNMNSEWLQCVADVVAFSQRKKVKQHATYTSVRRDVIPYFLLIKLKDVDWLASWDYKQILGC